MNNHWKEEEFLEYLDRRSVPEARARLEAHLVGCAECRRQLEEFRALGNVLDEWTPAPVSAGFETRLRARLAEEQPAPRGWFVLRPAFAIGLAAVAALAVAVMLSQSPEPDVVQVNPPTPALTVPAPDSAAPQVPPSDTTASTAETEALALLEDPVLLSDYELLEEFDILFESLDKENGKTL